jgi:hypothetical protein
MSSRAPGWRPLPYNMWNRGAIGYLHYDVIIMMMTVMMKGVANFGNHTYISRTTKSSKTLRLGSRCSSLFSELLISSYWRETAHSNYTTIWYHSTFLVLYKHIQTRFLPSPNKQGVGFIIRTPGRFLTRRMLQISDSIYTGRKILSVL